MKKVEFTDKNIHISLDTSPKNEALKENRGYMRNPWVQIISPQSGVLSTQDVDFNMQGNEVRITIKREAVQELGRYILDFKAYISGHTSPRYYKLQIALFEVKRQELFTELDKSPIHTEAIEIVSLIDEIGEPEVALDKEPLSVPGFFLPEGAKDYIMDLFYKIDGYLGGDIGTEYKGYELPSISEKLNFLALMVGKIWEYAYGSEAVFGALTERIQRLEDAESKS